MATALFPNGLLHPVQALRKRWSKHSPIVSDRNADEPRLPGDGAQSEDRLERIAAYARSGYFHVEYTAGMFVVPLDMPPE
jgi:hypothetical protein